MDTSLTKSALCCGCICIFLLLQNPKITIKDEHLNHLKRYYFNFYHLFFCVVECMLVIPSWKSFSFFFLFTILYYREFVFQLVQVQWKTEPTILQRHIMIMSRDSNLGTKMHSKFIAIGHQCFFFFFFCMLSTLGFLF